MLTAHHNRNLFAILDNNTPAPFKQGAFLVKCTIKSNCSVFCAQFLFLILYSGTKSVDTQSSQYYNPIVLNRKEIYMYSTLIVVIISIIGVLLGIELKTDGFVL